MMKKIALRYERSPFRIDYDSNTLRLNLNENLVLPSAKISKILRDLASKTDSRFYPSDAGEGEMKTLRSLIARYCKVKEWMVEIGCGSDQLIDLLCRMKLSKGSKLVTVKPTFSMYELRARLCVARIVKVPLGYSLKNKDEPFPLSTENLVSASHNASLLMLASPNNPTAIQYSREQLKEILDSLSPKTTFVLDEAYVEYAKYSATFLLRKSPQLVILRTFSKAFGLASQRLGYFVSSNRELIREFENGFQYPFPITALGALVASKLLEQRQMILDYSKKTVALREELVNALAKRGVNVVSKSDTNFILVQSPQAENIARTLYQKYQIAVKYLPNMVAKKPFLRITVGTYEMNSRLVEALAQIDRDLKI